MILADKWKDYEVIETGNGDKLERWGNFVLLRPDPQVIWKTNITKKNLAHGVYKRSSSGGGHWDFKKDLPEQWNVSYRNLSFIVKPTGFKHTGLFPEQAANWDFIDKMISESQRDIKVLNLFAYTGGATIAAAAAGANVCHVDASKGMVAWAKDNAKASGLSDKPIRYIVDDVLKFVLREQRRGNKYHAIIMDPPSYGRGPGGEIWKLENELYNLVLECVKVLDDNPLFFIINSYTTGLAPSVLSNILTLTAGKKFKIKSIHADELGLPVTEGGIVLPCGSTARCIFGE
ncbi:MAG: class I SAM-dependent methyltransferase [Clostridia bacterium]|nr:class I SAM-dependent methyltransferase [Clostridia bacterium]